MPNPNLITMARWLARKAIKAELRAAGIRPEHVEVRELHLAANAYFKAYRTELIEEARDHPATRHFQEQERMRLARKVVRPKPASNATPPYRNFVES
jgi:hypothetical protein